MADKVTDGAAKAVSRRSPRGNIAAYKHLNTGNIQPLPFPDLLLAKLRFPFATAHACESTFCFRQFVVVSGVRAPQTIVTVCSCEERGGGNSFELDEKNVRR
jgi:hypothetical protein